MFLWNPIRSIHGLQMRPNLERGKRERTKGLNPTAIISSSSLAYNEPRPWAFTGFIHFEAEAGDNRMQVATIAKMMTMMMMTAPILKMMRLTTATSPATCGGAMDSASTSSILCRWWWWWLSAVMVMVMVEVIGNGGLCLLCLPLREMNKFTEREGEQRERSQ